MGAVAAVWSTWAARRPALRVVAVGLVLLAAACGGSGSSPGGPSGPPPTTLPPPASIAGRYTLSIQTSSICSTQIARSWGATITQVGADATVDVAGVLLGLPFTCKVQGTAVQCPGIPGGSVAWIENLGSTNYLQVIGVLQGTYSGTSISGRLNGQIGRPLRNINCSAADHQFSFRPR